MNSPRRAIKRRPNWFFVFGLCLVLLSLAIVAAPFLSLASATDPGSAQIGAMPSVSSATAKITPSPKNPATATVSATPTPQATPTRIRVGVAGIDTVLTPSRIDEEELVLPEAGAALLPSQGTTIIAAHLYVGSRPGAFSQLHQVRQGMLIEIHSGQGVELWRTTLVQTYPKGKLPASIFDGSGPRRLALITCSGSVGTLDHPGHAQITGEPLDNLVVFAEPV